jgi:hypothetical protein
MRYLKGITIAIITILIVLYLAAFTPWRNRQGGKDSAIGLNVPQNGASPATGAQEVNPSGQNLQRPAREVKQQVTNTQSAKRHGKSAKPLTAKARPHVKQESEDLEIQDFETQEGERVIINFWPPVENIKAVSIESIEYGEVCDDPCAEPADREYIEDSSNWSPPLPPPPSARIYIAVPEPQECPTPYGVGVEYCCQ